MKGLIGYTGFVGGNLVRQEKFDCFYNSVNSNEIERKQFDLLVSAGVPSLKWFANKEPDIDLKAINKLISSLQRVEAKKVVLISTIDVYTTPINVDEDSIITPTQQPYGKHRFLLENFIKEKFDTLIVRLPNLFGVGLKKNIIYDFLNNNQIEKIDSESIFQFYNLEYLWKDISIALKNDLKIINVATEPVSVREIARYAFEFEHNNQLLSQPVKCDFHTRHADLWGKQGQYLYDKTSVLSDLKKFVENYKNFKLKLAVSSIGWHTSEDGAVKKILSTLQVKGVEISPDRLFNEKLVFDDEKIKDCRVFWNKEGIELVSIQGVLFTKDNLQIFHSEENRRDTKEYLKKIIDVSEQLGNKIIMFGAPKNRRRNSVLLEEAEQIAIPFFRELAEYAYNKGIFFCIEHNPKEYGSDYLEKAADVVDLAKKINHPGFGINIDTGALVLTNESSDIILQAAQHIKHVHISEPHLLSVTGINETFHQKIYQALRKIQYHGWISIEMKKSVDVNNAKNIEDSIYKIRTIYSTK